jgi:Na+/melibiose symporter-like transporter
MVVLMLVTIVYLPLVLPLLLPGSVQADSWQAMVMVVGVIGLIILFATAGELGRRSLARNPEPNDVGDRSGGEPATR